MGKFNSIIKYISDTFDTAYKSIGNFFLLPGSSPDADLYHSILQNRYDKARNTLNNTNNTNLAQKHLHSAVFHNRYKILELLLIKGADPNKLNSYNETPLHTVCEFSIMLTSFSQEQYTVKKLSTSEKMIRKHMIKLLLSYNAKLYQNDKAKLPMDVLKSDEDSSSEIFKKIHIFFQVAKLCDLVFEMKEVEFYCNNFDDELKKLFSNRFNFKLSKLKNKNSVDYLKELKKYYSDNLQIEDILDSNNLYKLLFSKGERQTGILKQIKQDIMDVETALKCEIFKLQSHETYKGMLKYIDADSLKSYQDLEKFIANHITDNEDLKLTLKNIKSLIVLTLKENTSQEYLTEYTNFLNAAYAQLIKLSKDSETLNLGFNSLDIMQKELMLYYLSYPEYKNSGALLKSFIDNTIFKEHPEVLANNTYSHESIYKSILSHNGDFESKALNTPLKDDFLKSLSGEINEMEF